MAKIYRQITGIAVKNLCEKSKAGRNVAAYGVAGRLMSLLKYRFLGLQQSDLIRIKSEKREWEREKERERDRRYKKENKS